MPAAGPAGGGAGSAATPGSGQSQEPNGATASPDSPVPLAGSLSTDLWQPPRVLPVCSSSGNRWAHRDASIPARHPALPPAFPEKVLTPEPAPQGDGAVERSPAGEGRGLQRWGRAVISGPVWGLCKCQRGFVKARAALSPTGMAGGRPFPAHCLVPVGERGLRVCLHHLRVSSGGFCPIPLGKSRDYSSTFPVRSHGPTREQGRR